MFPNTAINIVTAAVLLELYTLLEAPGVVCLLYVLLGFVLRGWDSNKEGRFGIAIHYSSEEDTRWTPFAGKQLSKTYQILYHTKDVNKWDTSDVDIIFSLMTVC